MATNSPTNLQAIWRLVINMLGFKIPLTPHLSDQCICLLLWCVITVRVGLAMLPPTDSIILVLYVVVMIGCEIYCNAELHDTHNLPQFSGTSGWCI